MMKCGMLSWSFRSESISRAPIPARRRQAGPGLRPGAIQPRRLAAVRRRRNSLLISPSPARGNQLNFRFYRVPQDAKYSARQARSSKTPPAFLHSVCTSCVIPRKLHHWCGYGRGKPTAGWFSMSALCAQGSLAACGRRFETRVLLKPGSDTGFQEGNSGLCGVRPACAAGSRQGTRPLGPD